MSGLIQPAGDKPLNALTEPAWPRVLPVPDSASTAGASEMGDLKEVLAIVRRRRLLVAFAGLAGASIAAYFAYVAKPIYLATASVRIADARQALSGGIADAPRDNIGST